MDAMSLKAELPVSVTDEYLENIANIDKMTDQYQNTYQYIRRSVEPAGYLVHEKIILKLYYMLRQTESLPDNLVMNLEQFIRKEIDNSSIYPKQGIGFAILSQGFLSVNIWGRGNVLFTQNYTIEGSYPELSRKPLEQTGVACTWEIRVMKHEYDLWHDYLLTEMRVMDKRKYLESFLSGKLY